MATAFLVSTSIGANPEISSQAVGNAGAMAERFQAEFSGENNLSTKLMNPLTSTNSMTTLDGKTFNAQIGCLEELQYLELFVIPTETGDLNWGAIRQDTDRDGELDRYITPEQHISGVCANGFISCDRGTWNNCESFQFTTNPAFEIELQSVPLSTLGGCYCVNNSCGTHLGITNLTQVLNHLGGGASAALAEADPYFVTNKVSVRDTTISFYGQNSSNCTSVGTNNHQLFDSPHALSVNAMSQASVDPLYEMLESSPIASETSDISTQTCLIERMASISQVDVMDTIRKVSGDGSLSSCGPNCVTVLLGEDQNEELHHNTPPCQVFDFNMELEVSRPDRVTQALISRARVDDSLQFWANGEFVYHAGGAWPVGDPMPTGCRIDTATRAPNLDVTSHFNQSHELNLNVKVGVGHAANGDHGGEGYVEVPIVFDLICEVQEESIVNACQGLERNSECTLFSEEVDGITVFNNYLPTGLTPLDQTRVISDGVCTQNLTRPFFQKKRTYHCNSSPSFDFSKGLERNVYVVENSTETEFHDRIEQADGSVVTSSTDLLLPDMPEIEPCIEVCKVQSERVANDVGRTQVIHENMSTPTKIDIEYLECSDSVCPTQEGQTVITSCMCADFFAETTSIMQTLRMGAQDTVCSSGTARLPEE